MASITKVIEVAAIMTLVDDGLVGLNRPVQEYEPDFVGEGKEAVMIWHLLTHTSGLRQQDVDECAARKNRTDLPPPASNQDPTLHEFVYLRRDAPLFRPPGQEMSYCSYGTDLLRDIVRRVTGKSMSDYSNERIFEPLGMKDTFFGLPNSRASRMVRRPTNSPQWWIESPEWLSGALGHTMITSTALDMAIFAQMFLQNGSYGPARVLSPASAAAMTRNQIPGVSMRFDDEYFPEASWGLGWSVQGPKRVRRGPTLTSEQTFSHNGAGEVWLWADPVSEIVGVYLSLTLSGVPGLYAAWNADLFANAVTAAIEE
jgi:CubicO group peptidase (beta-lactamase class C family)